MLALIKRHTNWSDISSFKSICKVIVNSMYENLVDDDVYNKDILIIIKYVLDSIVSSKKHYYEIDFQ